MRKEVFIKHGTEEKSSIKIDNDTIPMIIENAINDSSFIEIDLESPNDERVSHDPSIKNQYIKRDKSVDDSLYNIRANNFIDYNDVVLLSIDSYFGHPDHKDITEKETKKLLQHGLLIDDIEAMKKTFQQVRDDIYSIYEMKLKEFSQQGPLSEEDIERLKDYYCVTSKPPPFPITHIKSDRRPPLRITKENIYGAETYFALSTVIPMNKDTLEQQSFISYCIKYMILCIKDDMSYGLKVLNTSKMLYYDYYIVENCTIYFFLKIHSYDSSQ